MTLSKGIFDVRDLSENRTVFIGNYEMCDLHRQQQNAIYGGSNFVVKPHVMGTYGQYLLDKKIDDKKLSCSKTDTIKIILPRFVKCYTPPKLIPEETVKDKIKDYLKKQKNS
jgi:hypothetical protein